MRPVEPSDDAQPLAGAHPAIQLALPDMRAGLLDSREKRVLHRTPPMTAFAAVSALYRHCAVCSQICWLADTASEGTCGWSTGSAELKDA